MSDVNKAADAHKALLDEKIAAISALAKDIADNAATMDAKDLNAKISQLERIGWKIQGDSDVVNVSKRDGDVEKVAGRITAGLTEANERIMSLLPKIKAAKDEIPGEQLKELGDIIKLMSELGQRYPYPKAKAQKGTDVDDIPAIPKAIKDRAEAVISGATVASEGDQAQAQAAATPPAAATTTTTTEPPVVAAPGTEPPAGTEPAAVDTQGADEDWPDDMAPDPKTSKNPIHHWGHRTPAQATGE